jgi:hypothetical protein
MENFSDPPPSQLTVTKHDHAMFQQQLFGEVDVGGEAVGPLGAVQVLRDHPEWLEHIPTGDHSPLPTTPPRPALYLCPPLPPMPQLGGPGSGEDIEGKPLTARALLEGDLRPFWENNVQAAKAKNKKAHRYDPTFVRPRVCVHIVIVFHLRTITSVWPW